MNIHILANTWQAPRSNMSWVNTIFRHLCLPKWSIARRPCRVPEVLTPSRPLRALAGVVVLASALSSSAAERSPDYDYDVPLPGTYTLPVIKAAGDGALVDSTGKAVRLVELTRGRVTILSFIYTRCAAAKACPMATGVLMQLHRESAKDGVLARGLRLVSLSFDASYDTPERMAAYSRLAADRPAAAPWHFVTARSQVELQPILDAYGQAVDRKANPGDPAGPLNHTLRVFLVDATGSLRNIYSSGTLDVRLVLADIRTLLQEQHKGEVERGSASARRRTDDR